MSHLVSDTPGIAPQVDSALVNPWGIVATADGNLRIADNGSGVSTVYSRAGTPRSPVIIVPPPGAAPPTGIVVNDLTGAFRIKSGGRSGESRFIFAGEDGTISAWSPAVNPDTAIQVAVTTDAVYKGIAEGQTDDGAFLFATNFHAGAVDVFDKRFRPVVWEGAFVDPNLPDGYGPFNILNVGGRLFVTFAKQKPDRHDDEAGPGLGFIDVFDTEGHLLRRLVSQGVLNAPWGMAISPSGFGDLGGDLLVGNFGDGRINAFDPVTGKFRGGLEDTTGAPISIDGLWGLAFGRGSGGEADDDDDDSGHGHDHGRDSAEGHGDGEGHGHSDGHDHGQGRGHDNPGAPTLYFAAGIADESHGLFGSLSPANGSKARKGDDRPGEGRNAPSLEMALIHGSPARLSDASGVQWRVSIAAPDVVSLRVYDASGRLVAEPLRDLPLSGTTIARWDLHDSRGAAVPAGLYFYRGTTGAGSSSGRLVLLH